MPSSLPDVFAGVPGLGLGLSHEQVQKHGLAAVEVSHHRHVPRQRGGGHHARHERGARHLQSYTRVGMG